MLNVGPLELVVVLAVALIVVGPERLPELARSVGRVIRQFRDVQNEVRDLVSSEMDDADVRGAVDEFRKAAGGVTRATDVKGAVRRAERTIRDETTKLRTPRPARGPASTPRTDAPAGAPDTPTAPPDAAGIADAPQREGPSAPERPEPETPADR
jgi:Tat protein translocase TatB subunit